MNNKFRGTGVALITPFTETKAIDIDALKNLVEKLISDGIDYLVILGTTSESATLSSAEKQIVKDTVIDANNSRVPIVMGYGGNNTTELLENFDKTDFSGIDAILTVVPFYNKPNQEGIYQHFAAIARKSPVPLILYNVPGRTAQNMNSETCLRLANEFKNIVAVKEASGDIEQCMEIINNRPEGFLLLSGEDLLTLPIIASGGDGVISVAAHVFPKDFSEMINSALSGNLSKARDLHYKQIIIMQQIFADGNPAGVKAAISMQGRCKNILRRKIKITFYEKTTFLNIFCVNNAFKRKFKSTRD